MGTTTGFWNIHIFEIPDMRSFEELHLIEALEVIKSETSLIWDGRLMHNVVPVYLYEFQKRSEEGLGTCKIPRVEALVLQSCVPAVMISSLLRLTWAFPLMHLYMYISVDKKLSLLIHRVCNPKSFTSAPLVLIKSKLPVMMRAALLWSLQIYSLERSSIVNTSLYAYCLQSNFCSILCAPCVELQVWKKYSSITFEHVPPTTACHRVVGPGTGWFETVQDLCRSIPVTARALLGQPDVGCPR